MCGQSLAMPVKLTGQDGAVLKQTTRIAVSGCPSHKAHGKPKHAAHGEPTRKA
jgi:hypothetical protein